MTKIFKYYTLLIGLLFTSCALDNDADIEFPGSEQAIMIECYLQPNKNFELSMMENNTFQNDLILQLVWNADVLISSDNSDIELRNILNIKKNTNYVHNYGTPLLVPDNYTGEYRLNIVTDAGKHLTATTSTVEFVPISNVFVEDWSLSVNFQLDSKIREKFFAVIAEGKKGDEEKLIIKDFDLSAIDEENTTISVRGDFKDWDSLKVKLLHISEVCYNFRKSVEGSYSANIDPFTVPIKMNSNIKGGLGIFTYYTIDSLILR